MRSRRASALLFFSLQLLLLLLSILPRINAQDEPDPAKAAQAILDRVQPTLAKPQLDSKQLDDLVQSLRHAYQLAMQSRDGNLFGRVCFYLGLADLMTGNEQEAQKVYEFGVTLLEKAGENDLVVASLGAGARIAAQRNLHDSQIKFLEMLAEFYGRNPNPKAQAEALSDLLDAYDKKTEMHAFCNTLENQLLPLYQKLNDQPGLAVSWFAEGKCREAAGDIPGAIANSKKSIDALRALGDKSTLAAALDDTAETLRTHGRAAEALPMQKEAVSLRKNLNVPRDYAKSLNDLAMADEELGHLSDAVIAIEECVRIVRTINDPDALATSLNNQAGIYRDAGRIGEAIKSVDESMQISRDNCLTDDAKTAMRVRATIYAVTGDSLNAMAAEAVASDTTDICEYKKFKGERELPGSVFETGKARIISAAQVRTPGRFVRAALQAQSPAKPDESWIITGKTPIETVNELLESASKMLDDKQPGEAIETLNKALLVAQQSGNKSLLAAAYAWLGNAQIRSRNEVEAQKAIDASVALLLPAGDSDDAVHALQMAIDLARENNLPGTRAKYLRQLSEVDRDSGLLDEAGKNAKEALQVARDACLTEEARGAMNVLATVDSAMGKAGKAAEERALALETKDICDGKRNQSPADTTEPAYMKTHNMSLELARRGAYPKAIENFKADLKKGEDDGDAEAIVSAHEGLAYAYAESSRFTLAESDLLEAERIERGLDNPRALSRIQISRANVYIHMGRYYDALDVYDQVGKTAASLQDIQLQFTAMLTSADVYRRLKSYDKAFDDAQRALQLVEKTGFRNLASQARQIMGLVQLAQDNYQDAEDLFRAAAKDNPEQPVLDDALVEVFLSTGRYAEAEKELERASADTLSGADSGYRLQYYTQRGIARMGLNRHREAIEDFNLAIHEAEEMRTQVLGLKSSGFLDAGSFGGRIRPYRGMLEAFATLQVSGFAVKASIGGEETDASHAAFHFAELSRGRSLAENMAASRFDELRKQVPQSVLDEEARITTEGIQLAQRHEQAHPDSPATTAENEEFSMLRAQARAFLASLEKNYPLYASVYSAGSIPVDELPLASDEVLIEYALGLEHVFVFVISSDHSLHCYRLPVNVRQLRGRVRAFRNLITGKRFSPSIAYELFSTLLGAIPGYDKLPRRLIIVPDSFLALLPFEALNSAQAGDPRFLAIDHSIVYAQSASVLTWTRTSRRAPAGKPLFAVGDPIFALDDSRVAEKVVAQLRGAEDPSNTRLDSLRQSAAFRRLPETQAEVKTLASILGVQPAPPDVLIGSSAAKATVLQNDLGAYRILHFATHASALGEPGRVNEPFLVLNQVGNPPGDNGLLTMSEVMDLKLNSDLVVLSACDTGAGDVLEGDGVASLASAFQFAGSRSVLLSLWQLPSDATLPFMRAFYLAVTQGRSHADALAAGREAMRREFPDPYYWAVFSLYSGASL